MIINVYVCVHMHTHHVRRISLNPVYQKTKTLSHCSLLITFRTPKKIHRSHPSPYSSTSPTQVSRRRGSCPRVLICFDSSASQEGSTRLFSSAWWLPGGGWCWLGCSMKNGKIHENPWHFCESFQGNPSEKNRDSQDLMVNMPNKKIWRGFIWRCPKIWVPLNHPF